MKHTYTTDKNLNAEVLNLKKQKWAIIVNTKKHPKVYDPTGSFYVTFSKTPSCYRTHQNFIKNVKSVCRKFGINPPCFLRDANRK